MRPERLVILRGATSETGPLDQVVSFDTMRHLVRSGRILAWLGRYRDVRLITPRVGAMPRPLMAGVLVRVLSRRSATIEDPFGNRMSVSLPGLALLLLRFLRDLATIPWLLRATDRRIAALEAARLTRAPVRPGAPVYVRSDLWFGVQSGGSVGHIAGVLNELDRVGPRTPILVTADPVPTVREDIDVHIVLPEPRFWDFRELPSIAYNDRLMREARLRLGSRAISFVYQRYSVNSYAGVELAASWDTPLVLEYNGSEVWIERNWGRPLKYESRSLRIENAVLRAADLVVVVSEPMRSELVERGVRPERILVNPNGVDTERYSPTVDGSAIRSRLGLDDQFVIGFIGTFGPWHGAEVLAEAFVRLLKTDREAGAKVRLLMIGDGPGLEETRRRVARGGAMDNAIFVGRTAQSEGASYLAACDLLASPHVPNADGSPFFGSPTKLFEYMAMGKAIVASRLDQIGEVLEDGQTAVLVPPGDVQALADAMRRLMDDPELRSRLGRSARERAVTVHTWRAHTRRIVEALETLSVQEGA